MRQRRRLTPADEPHLVLRSLSATYASSGQVPTHRHRRPQFLYAAGGALRAEVDRSIWMVPPGRGLWLPAGIDHALTALGQVDLRTFYCGEGFGVDWDVVRSVTVCGLLHEAILRACVLGALDDRQRDEARLAELIAAELYEAPTHPQALVMPGDPRARRLAELLVQQPSGESSLDSSLSVVGLSRRTAERLFRAETGLSPARWRQQLRLAQSYESLAAGASVADVAHAAGYSSASAFSTAFKSVLGVVPSAVAKARSSRGRPSALKTDPSRAPE